MPRLLDIIPVGRRSGARSGIDCSQCSSACCRDMKIALSPEESLLLSGGTQLTKQPPEDDLTGVQELMRRDVYTR